MSHRIAAPAALVTALLSWAAAAGPSAPAPSPRLEWRLAAEGAGARGIGALASEPGSGRLAVGDVQGVLLGRPGEPFERALQRGPVQDLAFLPDGPLLVATPRGLFRVSGVGGAAWIAPAPGAAASSIQRIAVIPGVAALATGAGLFVSRDARSWQRLSGALPRSESTAVALRRDGEALICFGLVDGELWRVVLREDENGFSAALARRETIPSAIRGTGPVDLATDLPEAALVVVYPRALAARRRDAPEEAWRVWQPELPPGASARRLGHGAGRYWLTSDRGLLVSTRLAGPWRRTAPPIGSSAVTAAASVGGRLFAATRDDLRVGRPQTATTGGTRSDAEASAPPPPPGPPIARVHREALHYLGLRPERMQALRRGARRRAWWPVVVLRGAGAWDHGRSVDDDQSFLSGATRFLRDDERDRSDEYDVSLSLSWDLGGVAYEPESIDVSRETRQVTELRDDVLDEITQLYFERRRVLVQLGGAPGGERERLRLRANELAAGIDAWTGGWFGEQLESLAP